MGSALYGGRLPSFGVPGSRPHLRNVIASEDQRYTIKRSNHPLTTYIAPWPVDLCSAGKSQATRELRGEDLPRDSVSAAVKRSSIARHQSQAVSV